jgi:hypothetical protein
MKRKTNWFTFVIDQTDASAAPSGKHTLPASKAQLQHTKGNQGIAILGIGANLLQDNL